MGWGVLFTAAHFLWSCLSLFHHFTCKLLVARCWTQDASLTRNRFPRKTICVQIRLRHPCGALMLTEKLKYFKLQWTLNWPWSSVLNTKKKMLTEFWRTEDDFFVGLRQKKTLQLSQISLLFDVQVVCNLEVFSLTFLVYCCPSFGAHGWTLSSMEQKRPLGEKGKGSHHILPPCHGFGNVHRNHVKLLMGCRLCDDLFVTQPSMKLALVSEAFLFWELSVLTWGDLICTPVAMETSCF